MRNTPVHGNVSLLSKGICQLSVLVKDFGILPVSNFGMRARRIKEARPH